jgi:hypothetical protein
MNKKSRIRKEQNIKMGFRTISYGDINFNELVQNGKTVCFRDVRDEPSAFIATEISLKTLEYTEKAMKTEDGFIST